MAVQNGYDVVHFDEATLETLDGLGRKRNFRHKHDRATAAFERNANGLQINFGFPAAGDAVQQNRFGGLGRSERLSNFVQRSNLFRI